jgi:hypothetical protein
VAIYKSYFALVKREEKNKLNLKKQIKLNIANVTKKINPKEGLWHHSTACTRSLQTSSHCLQTSKIDICQLFVTNLHSATKTKTSTISFCEVPATGNDF